MMTGCVRHPLGWTVEDEIMAGVRAYHEIESGPWTADLDFSDAFGVTDVLITLIEKMHTGEIQPDGEFVASVLKILDGPSNIEGTDLE